MAAAVVRDVHLRRQRGGAAPLEVGRELVEDLPVRPQQPHVVPLVGEAAGHRPAHPGTRTHDDDRPACSWRLSTPPAHRWGHDRPDLVHAHPSSSPGPTASWGAASSPRSASEARRCVPSYDAKAPRRPCPAWRSGSATSRTRRFAADRGRRSRCGRHHRAPPRRGRREPAARSGSTARWSSPRPPRTAGVERAGARLDRSRLRPHPRARRRGRARRPGARRRRRLRGGQARRRPGAGRAVEGSTRVLLRPPAILGAGETSVWNTVRPAHVREDERARHAIAEQSFAWVHVDDLAALAADVAVGCGRDLGRPGGRAGRGRLHGRSTWRAVRRRSATTYGTVTRALGVEPVWEDGPAWTGQILADRARRWGWTPRSPSTRRWPSWRPGCATDEADAPRPESWLLSAIG